MREDLVINHAKAMLETLNMSKNLSKGPWTEMHPYDLLELLKQEVRELEAAIWRWEHTGESGPVRSESADVSNYAAMISDVCQSCARKF